MDAVPADLPPPRRVRASRFDSHGDDEDDAGGPVLVPIHATPLFLHPSLAHVPAEELEPRSLSVLREEVGELRQDRREPCTAAPSGIKESTSVDSGLRGIEESYAEESSRGRSSENWCMVPRYGFPRSTDLFVVRMESAALPHLTASRHECERLWHAASRGLPLLANLPACAAGTLRKLARKHGLPSHLRGIMWLTLSGTALKMNENEYFCSALLRRHGYMTGEHAVAIQRDLERTFPEHPYFSGNEEGLRRLKNILHALCWRNPLLNYCQSFNFLAALTLLVVDDEEACFWLLCHILENLIPNDFYSESLVGAKVDQRILPILVVEYLPRLAAHFKEIGFDAGTLVPAWMLSLYINVFPFETVLRVWDYLVTDIPPLGQSSHVPMTIMIAFLKLHMEGLLRCEDSSDVIMHLSRSAKTLFNANRLMQTAAEVKLKGCTLVNLRRRFKGVVMEETHKKKQRHDNFAVIPPPSSDAVAPLPISIGRPGASPAPVMGQQCPDQTHSETTAKGASVREPPVDHCQATDFSSDGAPSSSLHTGIVDGHRNSQDSVVDKDHSRKMQAEEDLRIDLLQHEVAIDNSPPRSSPDSSCSERSACDSVVDAQRRPSQWSSPSKQVPQYFERLQKSESARQFQRHGIPFPSALVKFEDVEMVEL